MDTDFLYERAINNNAFIGQIPIDSEQISVLRIKVTKKILSIKQIQWADLLDLTLSSITKELGKKNGQKKHLKIISI